jgi:hypothetical protein
MLSPFVALTVNSTMHLGVPRARDPSLRGGVTQFGDSAGTLLAFSSRTNNNPTGKATQGS